jgi:hypothetical protein
MVLTYFLRLEDGFDVLFTSRRCILTSRTRKFNVKRRFYFRNIYFTYVIPLLLCRYAKFGSPRREVFSSRRESFFNLIKSGFGSKIGIGIGIKTANQKLVDLFPRRCIKIEIGLRLLIEKSTVPCRRKVFYYLIDQICVLA